MNDDRNQSEPHVIPEPTTFEQARDDGVAERIASGDTAGGSDQFEKLQRSDESLAHEGDDSLGQDQDDAARDKAGNDEATRLGGHGAGSRLSNTEAATGGGGTSTF